MIGHRGHPEVEGTVGQLTEGIHLVEDVQDVERLQLPASTPLAVVTQTTLSVDDAAEIKAYVRSSNLDATGALTVDAKSDQTINAKVGAISVALSAGVIGASLSGAGAGADNRIQTDVSASIEGDKDEKGVQAGSVHVQAIDDSDIDSFTGAAGIALSLGGAANSIAIGVGVATNQIDNDVVAGYKR
jgi:hypothetical protein